MKELLENIFISSGFLAPAIHQNVLFFQKENENQGEYYLVDFIEASNIKGYLESEATQDVFTLFERQKEEKSDIEKNTSLVVCIKVGNVKNEINQIRNNILKIEEDDFWFKKYVIIYSELSLPDPTTDLNYVDHFTALLSDAAAFKEYKSDIYLNEQYFLAIQMFLKLPFLSVPVHNTGNYLGIEEIFRSMLSEDQTKLMERLRTSNELHNPSYWEDVKSNSVQSSGSNSIINEFLERFKPDA